MNIIERTDEEIRAMADPLWRDLLKYSNEGKYGEFAKRFAKSLACPRMPTISASSVEAIT